MLKNVSFLSRKMKLNKFDINEFVNEEFTMKCLFLYDGIYVQGKLVRSKNFLTIYLYDLWKYKYKFICCDRIKEKDENS